jgi:hypothetical protein
MSLENIVKGKYVVIAPSVRHVKALQTLLGNRFPVGDPITLEEAKEKLVFPQMIIFIAHDKPIDYARRNDELPLTGGVKRTHLLRTDHTKVHFGELEGRDIFLANDVFILNDETALLMRDQTGWKYGDKEEGVSTRDVLAKFSDTFVNLGEQ